MSSEAPTVPGLEVGEPIGQGGFATVWRASDRALGREVAVKVISTRITDETTAMRFERECRALGAVSGHPNIVTVHQVGTTDQGYPYLVMGYERGGSYGARISQRPLAWREAVEIGVKVADALEVAHRAGVLHRDVKPDNILISEYGEPKLTDFGIARLLNGPHTSTAGGVTASVAHAPPEVLHGRTPDTSSDVYSLCSTVHALITGRPPFFNESDESLIPLINRIATDPPPHLPAPAPGSLHQVLVHGMAKEPADRIRSAGELAAGFRAVLNGDPVPAVPATPGGPGGPGWLGDPTRQAPTPTPIEPSGAARSRRTGVLVAAGVLALGAAIVGGALLADARDDDPSPTTSSTNTSSDADQSTLGPTSSLTTGDAGTTTTDAGTTTAGADDGGAGSGADQVAALRGALLTAEDVGGLLNEENTAESGADPDHPFHALAYCNIEPDLSQVGAGAHRILTAGGNLIDPSAVVSPSLAVTGSPEAARALIDELVANAGSCDTYTYQGAIISSEITVVDAAPTEAGGRITVQIGGLLGGVFEQTAFLTQVDNVVTVLEIDSNSPDSERLVALLVERSADLQL